MHIFYACIHKIENRHNIVSSSLLLNLFLTVFGFLCYSKIKISIIFSFMSIELQFSAPLNGFFILRLTKQYRTIICKSYSVLFCYPSMVYYYFLPPFFAVCDISQNLNMAFHFLPADIIKQKRHLPIWVCLVFA